MTSSNSTPTTGRLLYVINHMAWFWSHRQPLAEAARDAGYKVYVAAYGADSDKGLAHLNLTGIGLPCDTVGTSPRDIAKTIWFLRQVCRRLAPDVVHSITLSYSILTGLASARGGKARTIYTIGGLGYLFSPEGIGPLAMRTAARPLLKMAFAIPDRVIFQNSDDLRALVSAGFVPSASAVLIPGSGVNINIFQPGSEPSDFEPVVAMPTRLVREKGVAVFVEAARILRDRGVAARFQIAGGIDESRNPNSLTRAEMNTLTAGGPVEWLQRVEDMPGLYRRASVVAFPSYYREGIPKVLLEAAACAKAIVTTDHPGCRDVVVHGESGLLVPVKNASALADAIEALLRDPAQRIALGRAARSRAEREFDERLIVQATLKEYSGGSSRGHSSTS